MNLSVTSLDLNWQRVLEPRTSSPHTRLDAIRQLRAAKIPVGVSGRTDHPGLTDQELPKILDASAKTGAQFAGYTIVRCHGPWPRSRGCYFGASEAMIASKRGSPRNGSQDGLRRRLP